MKLFMNYLMVKMIGSSMGQKSQGGYLLSTVHVLTYGHENSAHIIILRRSHILLEESLNIAGQASVRILVSPATFCALCSRVSANHAGALRSTKEDIKRAISAKRCVDETPDADVVLI
jgi:hypothetical protein